MPDEAPNANKSRATGKVTKFVVGTDWESYTQQLDLYFLANGVKEPKTKKAVLLQNLAIGEGFGPSQPKDDIITFPYNIIVERMQKQLKPERSALVVGYEFDNRVPL